MSAFSPATTWATSKGEYRAIGFTDDAGSSRTLVAKRIPSGWAEVATLHHGADNPVLEFDVWRVRETGFTMDLATAYPAWVKRYGTWNGAAPLDVAEDVRRTGFDLGWHYAETFARFGKVAPATMPTRFGEEHLGAFFLAFDKGEHAYEVAAEAEELPPSMPAFDDVFPNGMDK